MISFLPFCHISSKKWTDVNIFADIQSVYFYSSQYLYLIEYDCQVRWWCRCIWEEIKIRRLFFWKKVQWTISQKPKKLIELPCKGKKVSLFGAGVQRVQPFVQVKGGSLAQLSGVSPLSTGYYLTLKAARNLPLCTNNPWKEFKKGGNHNEIDKTQWSCRKEWHL